MSPAEVIRDLKRNHTSCFVFVQFPQSQDLNLFQIKGISEKESPQITLYSKKCGNLIINIGSEYRLLFKGLISGVFQCGREAVVATKRFATGYARGINTSNSVFTPVTNQYYNNGSFDLESSFESAENVINSMFTQGHAGSLGEAIGLLNHGDYISIALDRSFAISHSVNNSTGYTLFYRTRPIADIKENQSLVNVIDPVFDLSVKRLLNAY